MKAKALICDENQNVSLEEVIVKDPGPQQIVIKTIYSFRVES